MKYPPIDYIGITIEPAGFRQSITVDFCRFDHRSIGPDLPLVSHKKFTRVADKAVYRLNKVLESLGRGVDTNVHISESSTRIMYLIDKRVAK